MELRSPVMRYVKWLLAHTRPSRHWVTPEDKVRAKARSALRFALSDSQWERAKFWGEIDRGCRLR